MATHYIMPLGFIDRTTDDGAIFLLTSAEGLQRTETRHSGGGVAIPTRIPGPSQGPRHHHRRRLHNRHIHHRGICKRFQMA